MSVYTLTEDNIKEIFQAGARFGYSQRSKMAGAPGTDAPNWEEFIETFPYNICNDNQTDVCKHEWDRGNHGVYRCTICNKFNC